MEKLTLSENVIIYRKRAGLMQYELAEKAGVSALTILNIENGHSKPIEATLRCIAEALGCSVNDLKGDM